MQKTIFKISLIALTLVLAGAGCSIGKKKQVTTLGVAGIFVSADKGETWQSSAALPTVKGVANLAGMSVYKLFSDPQDPSALYWASRENGFVYSYDEGRTWQQPPVELQKGYIYSIAVSPTDKCTIFVSTGDRIMKSDDCNRSWTEMYRESRPNIRVSSLAINPNDSKQILSAESNGDLLESIDEGKSWYTISRFGVELSDIYADPMQKDVFYITSIALGLYRSLDKGQTWEPLAQKMKDFPKANEYRRFLIQPGVSGRLYWVSTYGILLSTDSGSTWEAINLITPPGSAQIYGFTVNPMNTNEIYYTATINNRSTFYKSVDGGVRWITKKLPSGQLPTVMYSHPQKENVLYLGFTMIPTK